MTIPSINRPKSKTIKACKLSRIKRQKKTPSWLDDFEVNGTETTSIAKLDRPKNKRKLSEQAIEKISTHSFFKATKTKQPSNLRAAQAIIKSLGITNMSASNYLPSIKDKNTLFTVKPVHILNSINGFGLFAKETIEQETCIGEYTGKEYTLTTFNKLASNQETSTAYAFQVGDKIIDAEVAGNFSRYINFSDSQANVEFRRLTINYKKHVVLVSIKPISIGQQLLINYNTYNEHDSLDYYFLNPQDNWQSTADLYEQHSEHYAPLTKQGYVDCFDIKEGDVLYLTQLGQCILTERTIEESSNRLDATVNLPYLTLRHNQLFIDVAEKDLYTPLMIACYRGQINNVDWLIKHGAHIDQQQNHSGNCPLFFALEGYRQTETKSERNIYVQIIILLLNANANATVHDRQDNTFLHKAISVMTANDLKLVMECLSTQLPTDIKHLYGYINNTDIDIVLYCLTNRHFEHASIVLSFYPDYFDENFMSYCQIWCTASGGLPV